MKMIELPHKVLDYACMINGLEDQYEGKTGRRLPGYLLMDVSSIGFCYITQKRAPAPRMIFWGTGMGKAQYEFLADIVGFRFTHSEGRPFKTAWQAARASLEGGAPALLGVLDMYHLPYFEKFYHRFHIPQHFVLLVGYDEDRDAALVQDCSRPGIQAVPLSDLQAAWNVRLPGQATPNTFYTFQFGERIADLPEIVHNGLKERARLFLESPVSFMGLRGLRRVQAEFPRWRAELSEAEWQESLRSLATFTCSVVPNPPQRLLPYPLDYQDPHHAVRDRFADELSDFAREYNEPRWEQAAGLFRQSGEQIGRLTDAAVDALQGDPRAFDCAPDRMGRIAQLEEAAFQLLA